MERYNIRYADNLTEDSSVELSKKKDNQINK